MSDGSGIEWTATVNPDGTVTPGATWNPIRGCTKVSAGCKNCYAETFAERWRGIPGHPFEQGFDLRLVPEKLDQPLRWKRGRRIFVNSMSDLFHEDVSFEYIAAVFGVMAACPQHTFQVLTKRAERMVEFFRNTPDIQGATCAALDDIGFERGCGSAFDPQDWPLPNVHLGVSVEDQQRADERIPLLLQCPAAVRWVSAEPLLGPVDLFGVDDGSYGPGLTLEHVTTRTDYGTGVEHDVDAQPGLDWVVVGGESGRDPRPFDVAWARSIVEQCRAAGVPVFYKQGGASNRCAHSAKGGCLDCAPEDLRVREFPR